MADAPGYDPGAAEGTMSEAQAAASLRINPRTLARWRKAGKVGCEVTPGGRIRYRFSDLLALRRAMNVSAYVPICDHKSGESGGRAA